MHRAPLIVRGKYLVIVLYDTCVCLETTQARLARRHGVVNQLQNLSLGPAAFSAILKALSLFPSRMGEPDTAKTFMAKPPVM